VFFSALLIIVGIGLLYYGGELLVSNSVSLARLWGLSPLVIGLTIVALGTSSPELAATLVASFRDAPAIAVGAVVGSNISNIGLILGLSALIFPIPSQRKFNRREMPFMIVTSALILPLFIGGVLTRWEGLILLGLLAFYLWYVLKHSNEAPPPVEIDLEALEAAPKVPVWGALLGVAIGIAFLSGGAQCLVDGASNIARSFGIPEKVIGLTLVAFGTSLPELASCVVAAMRKEGDIILGNIVGSNIFNVLCILGTAALCKPLALPMSEILIDYGVMMAFSLILVPFLLTGVALRRVEGAFLFLGYISYVFYLYVLM
jgi:cation:H+ antiporter